MQVFNYQFVNEEPKDQELFLYPDYLISCLLREGIGRIEADRCQSGQSDIEFVLTPRFGAVPRVIGRLKSGYFRSMLAHFGGRCSKEMLYGGHALFCCDLQRERAVRVHRFSLFLCNEPTMGCWLKLYLYCIDGVWPLREDTSP